MAQPGLADVFGEGSGATAEAVDEPELTFEELAADMFPEVDAVSLRELIRLALEE